MSRRPRTPTVLALIAALLGVLGSTGMAAAQAAPGKVSVSAPILGADGVIVSVTWAGSTPLSWASAYSDSAFFQQGTGASPLTLTLPYRSAPTTAWICIVTTCQTFAVPGRPAVLPEPTTHVVGYTEPTTRDCAGRPAPCTPGPLNDLMEMRIYWRVDDGAETMVTVPASGPAGGATREYTLTIPYASGTLSVTIAARTRDGQESQRTAPVTKVIGRRP
ncbi:MAG TPA: hypothetical protein VHT71_24120 [Methylomirabilota bacterium]|nr:hypothetical protein [Methylomirabilota bacterium]